MGTLFSAVGGAIIGHAADDIVLGIVYGLMGSLFDSLLGTLLQSSHGNKTHHAVLNSAVNTLSACLVMVLAADIPCRTALVLATPVVFTPLLIVLCRPHAILVRVGTAITVLALSAHIFLGLDIPFNTALMICCTFAVCFALMESRAAARAHELELLFGRLRATISNHAAHQGPLDDRAVCDAVTGMRHRVVELTADTVRQAEEIAALKRTITVLSPKKPRVAPAPAVLIAGLRDEREHQLHHLPHAHDHPLDHGLLHHPRDLLDHDHHHRGGGSELMISRPLFDAAVEHDDPRPLSPT